MRESYPLYSLMSSATGDCFQEAESLGMQGRLVSTAVTAPRLRNRPGDLEFNEAVVVDTEFAQHPVGVLSELRRSGQVCRIIAELHRIGYQLLRMTFGIDDFGDATVGGQCFVIGYFPGILYRGPLPSALA
jgi:hypothetical protein